ncbi:MAG: glycosyltransferase family 2 protein [Bacteroidales bacterium]|nr:glycosyltransferase family 2 protein [Bacteroidales bacterium]
MIHELSILIPTRNDVCLPQVKALQRLASQVEGLRYEILVADDASDNQDVLRQNAQINDLENCSLLLRPENTGRAANRNHLAQQAQFEWLLFLDCNVKIPNERFLLNYLEAGQADVVNGGIFAEDDKAMSRHNLRYQYEKKIEPEHVAEQRRNKPYQSFRTSNYMIRREIMLKHPLDESVPGYGYEDVLFGKTLCENGIPIDHIDNPVVMTHFESNENYVAKVEEAMRTLHTLRKDLSGYSPLLNVVEKLKKWHLIPGYRLFFKAFSKRLHNNLTGPKPSIKWLNPYKLGYYLSLEDPSV